MKARPLLLRMIGDSSLDEEARRPLLAALFNRDGAEATRWAQESLGVPEHAALVYQVLQQLTVEPEPDDRPLYLEALRSSDAVAQCFAIEGMLGLGESGAGWCDRLTSLLRSPHPGVRVRAAAGLAREGRREELPELRRLALEDPEPWLRAEALRWLGEVDMEGSASVVARGLADDGAWNDAPLGAAEAIWALSRRGTPEDLSRLLNAYPVLNEKFNDEKKYSVRVQWSLEFLLEECLKFHLARQEGHSHEELARPRCRESAYDLLERARSPEPRAEPFREGIPSALFEPWYR
ncbi:HEAT repeat domain-containing protein [Pyxidicoccus sp. 3LG]